MNVGLIYLNVVAPADENAPPPEHYAPWSERWVNSIKQFGGDFQGKIQIVHCGKLPTAQDIEQFQYLDAYHTAYGGAGWDIGAHQYAASALVFDFVICMATPCYLWRSGFFEAMIAARESYGPGLYGPSGSFENKPHIRHSCWAFDPKVFVEYPYRIGNRIMTYRAESGDICITEWFQDQGLPVIMVAPSGCYKPVEFRFPEEIFRKGTQENLYVRDRYFDLFASASPEEKAQLTALSDGKQNAENTVPDSAP